jgi:hypothetical protein
MPLNAFNAKIKITLLSAYSVLIRVTIRGILIKKYQSMEGVAIVVMIKNGKIKGHALTIIIKILKL